MKKSIISISILILVGLLLSYVIRQEYIFTDYSHISVKEVVDGDTVILANGKKLRYLGIDTPELRRKVDGIWRYDPRPLAEDSTEFNRGLVQGKYVKLEFDKEMTDKYGRLLAYVFLEDGTFINAELIKRGYARTMIIPPNYKYTDLLLRVEKEARENGRGLWAK